MGHLTRIANTVVQNLEKGLAHSQINDLIKGLYCRNISKEPQCLCSDDDRDNRVWLLGSQRLVYPQSYQRTAEAAGRVLWVRL